MQHVSYLSPSKTSAGRRKTIVWYNISRSPENHARISCFKQTSGLIHQHDFQTLHSKKSIFTSDYGHTYSRYKALTVQRLIKFWYYVTQANFCWCKQNGFRGNGEDAKSCIELFILFYIKSRSYSLQPYNLQAWKFLFPGETNDRCYNYDVAETIETNFRFR